ncbi:toxin biosynthesis protein [Aspergillus bertholletiae]|uniref:Toxin biosynthesis protein n=1 Tax=Aspergillus bertholletiae TaxID=1226010 RepID=A0A5N7BIJ4_9EURO|nr:toxin biosynthesis protein [Aspergillus bertholletiae]
MANSPFLVTEHLIDAQYIREYPRATATQDAPLKLSVKKYTPINNRDPSAGDITLIAVPGTGLPKEVYEPLWEELVARNEQDGFRIRAIWIADAVNQGASGIKNESHLGNDMSWYDHSRDMLHMINHFRDEMARPLIGLGHSIGAAQQVFLSLIHPRLFTSLILIEPFIHDMDDGAAGGWIATAAKRTDSWPSRSVAAKISLKVWRAWDPRAIGRWVEYGYRDLPTLLYPPAKTASGGERPVTLSTTKVQEICSYIRPNFHGHKQLGLPDDKDSPSPPHDPLLVPDMIGKMHRRIRFYRPEPLLAWRLLPHVRPSVLYLSGAKSGLFLSGHHFRAAKKTGTGFGGSGGREYNRVKHIIIDKSGHTLPMEKIAETAGAMGPWMSNIVRQWRDDEQRIEEGWSELPACQKSSFSDEWWRMLDLTDAELTRKKTSKL